MVEVPHASRRTAPSQPPQVPKDRGRLLRWTGLGAFVLVGLAILLFVRGGWRWPGSAVAAEKAHAPDRPLLRVTLVEGMPHTLFVPDDVRASLGIRNGAGDQHGNCQAADAFAPASDARIDDAGSQ